jgi:hypothetical protein
MNTSIDPITMSIWLLLPIIAAAAVGLGAILGLYGETMNLPSGLDLALILLFAFGVGRLMTLRKRARGHK